MKPIAYKIGMLVDHPNRPQWGPGKIVHVDASRVHVFFRDALERKARPIVIAAVPLGIAASQTDPVLDDLPFPIADAGSWRLPGNYRHASLPDQPAATKKKKTKAKETTPDAAKA
jgi:hypothetical protein